MEVAYIAGSAVTLLPSVLYAYMGIGILRPLAIILPVEVMEGPERELAPSPRQAEAPRSSQRRTAAPVR